MNAVEFHTARLTRPAPDFAPAVPLPGSGVSAPVGPKRDEPSGLAMALGAALAVHAAVLIGLWAMPATDGGPELEETSITIALAPARTMSAPATPPSVAPAEPETPPVKKAAVDPMDIPVPDVVPVPVPERPAPVPKTEPKPRPEPKAAAKPKPDVTPRKASETPKPKAAAAPSTPKPAKANAEPASADTPSSKPKATPKTTGTAESAGDPTGSATKTAAAEAPPIIRKPAFLVPPAPPAYPKAAQRRNQEGTVIIRARIVQPGRPDEVRIARSSGHRLLDEAAVRAAAQYQFAAHKIGDQIVAAWVEIPFPFVLN